jgi:hypothetical protein
VLRRLSSEPRARLAVRRMSHPRQMVKNPYASKPEAQAEGNHGFDPQTVFPQLTARALRSSVPPGGQQIASEETAGVERAAARIPSARASGFRAPRAFPLASKPEAQAEGNHGFDPQTVFPGSRLGLCGVGPPRRAPSKLVAEHSGLAPQHSNGDRPSSQSARPSFAPRFSLPCSGWPARSVLRFW